MKGFGIAVGCTAVGLLSSFAIGQGVDIGKLLKGQPGGGRPAAPQPPQGPSSMIVKFTGTRAGTYAGSPVMMVLGVPRRRRICSHPAHPERLAGDAQTGRKDLRLHGQPAHQRSLKRQPDRQRTETSHYRDHCGGRGRFDYNQKV